MNLSCIKNVKPKNNPWKRGKKNNLCCRNYGRSILTARLLVAHTLLKPKIASLLLLVKSSLLHRLCKHCYLSTTEKISLKAGAGRVRHSSLHSIFRRQMLERRNGYKQDKLILRKQIIFKYDVQISWWEWVSKARISQTDHQQLCETSVPHPMSCGRLSKKSYCAEWA